MERQRGRRGPGAPRRGRRGGERPSSTACTAAARS